MKLRIGDKVRFLNETGDGIVSRIKDKQTVFVEMQDGFEIPYLVSQLVPIHTELIIDNNADNLELNPDVQTNDAVYLIIEPDHELLSLVNDYKIYLFNSSTYNILYSYSIKDENYFQTLKHGELGAFQKILLKQVKIPFFNEYNYHKIECLFYKNSHFKTQLPLAEIVNVSPKSLAESKLLKHDEFKFPVYAFLLKEEFLVQENVEQELSLIDIARLKSVKEFNSRTKISKSNKDYLKSLEKEVDLHITELIENPEGLSNFEMLNIQLEKFDNELDDAIYKNMKKIIFIHGVGNGRLKQEIISRLNKTKGVTFQDASYKEYGFGATQVNIL